MAKAAKEVVRPTLFSMSIIAAAMMPIFTLERVEGRIFRPVALTYAFALLGARRCDIAGFADASVDDDRQRDFLRVARIVVRLALENFRQGIRGERHIAGCAACHPTPRDSFPTWNKTCTQGGCHATKHASQDSLHAGVVIVCDGSDAAARRVGRGLWNDPATGVMPHHGRRVA